MTTNDAHLSAAQHLSERLDRRYEEYRELWRKAEAFEILTDFPLHLDIELTSHCNLRCRMCWQSGLLNTPMGIMKDDLFQRIVSDGVSKGLRAVKLQSRGESFLHPRIFDLATYAKNAGVLDLQVTTNGTLLDNDEKVQGLLECGIDKVIFSIDREHDASALEIYGADRCPDVKSIVQAILKMRTANGTKKPEIRIQSMHHADESREDFLKALMCDFPGADEFRVSSEFSNFVYDESGWLSENYNLPPCTYLWTRMVINWNGDVSMCCRDYNIQVKLGNVNQTSIEDIWKNSIMEKYRYSHINGARATLPVCGSCDMCATPKVPSRSL